MGTGPSVSGSCLGGGLGGGARGAGSVLCFLGGASWVCVWPGPRFSAPPHGGPVCRCRQRWPWPTCPGNAGGAVGCLLRRRSSA
eukprot:1652647-Lingulodinium_polyedra.AAC.1